MIFLRKLVFNIMASFYLKNNILDKSVKEPFQPKNLSY
jgi:hypothetical protein